MTGDVSAPSTTATRILIVDDHELVRNGIRALLSEVGGLEVIGEACNGQEAVDLARELQPDVVLMDLRMPVMDGLEATRLITSERRSAAVLVLTGNTADSDVLPAIKAGASGYLLKDSSTAALVRGIRRVARGETSIDPNLALKLLLAGSHQRQPKPIIEALTRRELAVLRLVAQGLRDQEVADRLSLSERTVRSHMGHILAKLQLTNRTQVALYAVREGLAEPAKATQGPVEKQASG